LSRQYAEHPYVFNLEGQDYSVNYLAAESDTGMFGGNSNWRGQIGHRLTSIFLRDKDGRRPVYGGNEKLQTDPQWKDCLLFYEYFHGDNGAGIGASYQTGWPGMVASLIRFFGRTNPEEYLAAGHAGAFAKERDPAASAMSLSGPA
jgi:hypothetical protein